MQTQPDAAPRGGAPGEQPGPVTEGQIGNDSVRVGVVFPWNILGGVGGEAADGAGEVKKLPALVVAFALDRLVGEEAVGEDAGDEGNDDVVGPRGVTAKDLIGESLQVGERHEQFGSAQRAGMGHVRGDDDWRNFHQTNRPARANDGRPVVDADALR